MRKTQPRFKLTMVSIYARGVQKTYFVHLPVSEDGKVRIDYNKFTAGLERGETFSVG